MEDSQRSKIKVQGIWEIHDQLKPDEESGKQIACQNQGTVSRTPWRTRKQSYIRKLQSYHSKFSLLSSSAKAILEN